VATTPTPRRAFVEQVMGMPVSVHVRGPVDWDVAETAVAQVFATLRRVDAVLSTWREESDLLRVRRGELDEAAAHPWLAEVRELCAEAKGRTGGLFDAGFDRSGYDPTGLVKGWAVERAALHLRHVPGADFCVNAGGDLVVGTGEGAVPTAQGWRIGIEDPADRTRVAAVVPLGSGGLATSGAAARGAHVVDPRSGAPVERPGSATVWGPSLMWADIWATALFVDPVEGPALLERVDPAYRCLVLGGMAL
jgi:thiamine biosynthesis lipoprotein